MNILDVNNLLYRILESITQHSWREFLSKHQVLRTYWISFGFFLNITSTVLQSTMILGIVFSYTTCGSKPA